ncbi:MAG: hypothetical protein J3K34DRAFT_446719 [Monoraphidium minutum]|nr:MAG: hypothetical protein J3K34DRAFT_446719 [Monoraphidium minutum]
MIARFGMWLYNAMYLLFFKAEGLLAVAGWRGAAQKLQHLEPVSSTGFFFFFGWPLPTHTYTCSLPRISPGGDAR